MRFGILLIIGCLLGPITAVAGSIYKCTTQEGVVFSQTPCAPDAVKLKSGRSAASQSAARGQEQPNKGVADAELFDGLGAETADVIIERAGHPAARYTHDGTEHWLYPNYVKTSHGVPVCPELLLENGRAFQITWLPQDVMKRSAEAARELAGWRQPGSIRAKSFTVENTDVRGESKSRVVTKFGEPDAKKIFNGREIWEYREVHLARGSADTLTIYLTFEGNTVVSSAGN